MCKKIFFSSFVAQPVENITVGHCISHCTLPVSNNCDDISSRAVIFNR